MGLSTPHKAALVTATATSAIAVTDAVTHGLTGDYSVFADDSSVPWLVALGGVVHGLTYLALCAVLYREAERFVTANRVARYSRWLVMVSLAVLAPGFVLVAPVLALTDVQDGAAYTAWGGLATAAFLGMILGSLALGLAVLRNRAMGIGGRLLSLMLPVLGLTLLLAWLAPDWAHPAYLEATLNFGIALLGVGAGAGAAAVRRERTAAVPAPTS